MKTQHKRSMSCSHECTRVAVFWPLILVTHAWAGGEAPTPGMSLPEIFKAGGVLMYPIALLSVIALALILYFLWALRPEQVVPKKWLEQFRTEWLAGHRDAARALCTQQPFPIAAIALAGLDYIREDHRRDPTLLKEVMEGEGQRQAARLQGQVHYLLDIAVVAPMIGLLGTVIGMLQAFNAVALDLAKARPMVLAAGVSLALITTAAGLIVAIPAMIAYAYFRNRWTRLVGQLEAAAADILVWLSRST